MESFREIDNLVQYLDREDSGKPDITLYRTVLSENADIVDLLRLLEKVNPCGQEYYLHQGIILISYLHHLNLLNFTRRLSLKAKVRIIGLPVSLCLSGVLAKKDAHALAIASNKVKVLDALKKMEGPTLVLNSESDLSSGNRTLSAFVFHNRFIDFQDYLGAMRATYRRKVSRVLEKGKDLIYIPIPPCEFTKEHHALYLSIMERTQNPLETLSIDFFREYDADIFEVRDKKSNLVGFVQMKHAGSTLYFMFCGFRKDKVRAEDYRTDPKEIETIGNLDEDLELNHIDLYYNMLLFIIRYGIEEGYERIEMGQTSEETKLKLGCLEVDRYLCLHHGNALLNAILQKLSSRFSYRGYQTTHHVFKEGQPVACKAMEKEIG